MPNNNPAKLAKLRMPDYTGSWWQVRPKVLTTLPVGKWTPVGVFDIPAKSFVRLKPSMRYEGLPQLSTLYGGWTQRTKFYFYPYRLVIPQLRKNRHLSWDSIPDLMLPKLRYFVNYSGFSSIEQLSSYANKFPISLAGSLLDRLGMAYGEFFTGNSFNNVVYSTPFSPNVQPVNYPQFSFSVNMLPLLAYLDAWMYGEFNPQDRSIPCDYDVVNVLGSGEHLSVNRSVSTKWINYQNIYAFLNTFGYGESLNYENPSEDGFLSPSYSPIYHSIDFNINYAQVVGLGQSRVRTSLIPGYPIFTLFVRPAFDVSSGITESGYVDLLRRVLDSYWDGLRNTTSTVGLLPVTYKGDYYTSWFNSDAIAKAQQFVVTNNESLLSLRKKNSDMMLSLLQMMSGERWVDYLQYVMDTDLELKDHPILIGYDEIDFGGVDIVSNADTTDAPQEIGSKRVLGGVAQKVRDYNSNVKPMTVKTKEPGLILVCTAIVPNVYYYQGVNRFMLYDTVADLWHPQYQKLGFQQTQRQEYYNAFASVPTKLLNYYRSSGSATSIGPINADDISYSAIGYVPLGWEHMTKPDILQGGMKTDAFKTWSLHRDFGVNFSRQNEGINLSVDAVEYAEPFDVNEMSNFKMQSTYVDSGSYNYMFENTSRGNSNNFVVRFEYDMSIYQPLAHTLIDKQGV